MRPGDDKRLAMEDFADELAGYVQELQFERACADGSLAKALQEGRS